MSECQIASPSPRPPIGTPSSLTLEITFISGCRGRKGLPYGFGPGGSSSPKRRLNSRICGSVSFWPRMRITRLSSQALRMAANVCASRGFDRSTPPTSAPSASPIFFTEIAAMFAASRKILVDAHVSAAHDLAIALDVALDERCRFLGPHHDRLEADVDEALAHLRRLHHLD